MRKRQRGKRGREIYVQWQIQTQHIRLREQFVERNVLRSRRQLIGQGIPIMIDAFHSQRVGLLLHVASDAAHAEDSERFTFGVVTKGRSGLACQNVSTKSRLVGKMS